MSWWSTAIQPWGIFPPDRPSAKNRLSPRRSPAVGVGVGVGVDIDINIDVIGGVVVMMFLRGDFRFAFVVFSSCGFVFDKFLDCFL